MSMLAERKQKEKWTLNPRGKYWSDDSNKFGQKMLEKMGWKVGNGLGANQNGITEHIKQSYKNDTRGIGFEDKGDQWTRHEVDFTSLLENLGSNDKSKPTQLNSSLEKKSKASKVRVHYRKFTQSKDLSRYTEKELANIFGRKTLENEIATVEKRENIFESEKDFGVPTIHGGSMTDYFKCKLKVLSKPITQTKSDDEKSSVEFKPAGMLIADPEIINKVSLSKVDKKRRKSDHNECLDNHICTDSISESMAFDNPTLDMNSPKQIKIKKQKLNVILEEDENEKDSLKKHKKINKKIAEDIEQKQEMSLHDNLLSKKTKRKSGTQIESKHEESTGVNVSEKKKMKKGIDNPVCTELEANTDNLAYNANPVSQQIEEAISSPSYTSRKKKKKRINKPACMESEVGADNLAYKVNSMQRDIEEVISNISKISRKNNKKGIDNLACTELEASTGNLTHIENSVQQEIGEGITSLHNVSGKKKKRIDKRIYRDSEVGADNLSFTPTSLQQNIKEALTTMSNIIEKKKKKGIDNPACTELKTGTDNLACTANSVQQGIEEAITSMSNAIDNYQLELENQLNEQKVSVEPKQNIFVKPKQKASIKPKKKDSLVPKLRVPMKSKQKGPKIKQRELGKNKLPLKKGSSIAKNKSVKQMIRETGDIRYKFCGSNLPKISGYGVGIKIKNI